MLKAQNSSINVSGKPLSVSSSISKSNSSVISFITKFLKIFVLSDFNLADFIF